MGQFFYFQDKLRHSYVIYPRGSTHMSRALAWMLSRFLIRMARVARFSCRFERWHGIKQGIRSTVLHVVLFPKLMEIKVSFSWSKTISRRERTLSVRTSWTHKLLPLFCKEWKKTVYSGIELIWEFPKQCLTITNPVFAVLVSQSVEHRKI